MAYSARTGFRGAAISALLMLTSAAVSAQQFERPPSFDIAKLPGIKRAGENYTIPNPVRSDGLLRVFKLETSYGQYAVHGDQMMRMRITELAALAQLEKISGSETFGKALVEAGISPLKYTGKFIADPAKTIGDTFSGIGNMFGRITADMNNVGKTPGDPLSGLLGVTDKKRELAAKMGVDPYTDFVPLDEKLSRLSEAAAAGGLTVSAALMVVPGAAGIVVSNLGTASTLEGVRIETLARDYTAAQIFDLNRQRMRAMGVDNDLIEALLANRSYTPIDMAVMVGSLDSMSGVADRAVFFQRAGQIKDRSIAYFMRRQAEMLAAQQRQGAGFARIVLLGGYPFCVIRDGKIVGAMPIDALSWPEDASRALRNAAADARRASSSGNVELRITGTATRLAKKELQSLGWRVVENVRF
jgi:hypothetical protein